MDKQKHRTLERATKNFLLLPPPSIGRKDMIITLPAEVREQILTRLAEQGLPETGVDFRVRLFGGHHKTFKREVLRPSAAIRTYIDSIGTPTGRKVKGRKASSDRLIPVGKFTDYLRDTQWLVKRFSESFNDFCPHYDEYLQAGRNAVDHNFPFHVEWHGQHVPVSQVLADLSPSLEKFREAFYVDLPMPRRMTLTDFSGLNIPAALVDKWAEQELQAVEEQLDNAKERLIESALDLVERVETQLSKSPDKLKLFTTLSEKAGSIAAALRDMVDNYDPSDLQLRNAAVAIEEKIASHTTDDWRNSIAARNESLRAAQAAKKVLKSSQTILDKKRQPEAAADASKPAAVMVGGGMLDDIL